MKYLLYNGLAGNGTCKSLAEEYLVREGADTELIDLASLDKRVWIQGVTKQDSIILCGGDGTLNRFINDLEGIEIPCPVFHYRAGTGNDFLVDLEEALGTTEVGPINEYIQNLPKIKVKDIECRFVNGIGYGIDGMCCEYADKMIAEGKKKVNYTSLAIKLCMFRYKAPNATIMIDGQELHYKKVWLASSMNGRYYGGGMKVAPEQKRNSGKVCLVVLHNAGRLKTLSIFPKIFKGAHVEHKRNVDVLYGNHIKVQFDAPMALQIDGETVLGVTEYEVDL